MKRSLYGRGSLVAHMVPALALAAGTTAAHAQCTGFTISSSTGASIVPGTTSIGNNGDDVTTQVALPFPVNFYGTAYSNATVSSNGNVQFTTVSTAYSNACLPQATMGVMLAPHWDDLRTDGGTTPGVYTSVTGVAPNRVFNIEWRAVYFSANTTAVNFEVRLFEDNSRVEYIYGSNAQSGVGATVGIQSATDANQFSCNTSSLSSGLKLTFTPATSATVLCSSGSANPPSVLNCSPSSTTLRVQVTPGSGPASSGIAVTGNLTPIGGAASQVFYDDATHGDLTAGDNVFSYEATVPASVASGSKALAFTATDLQGRTGAGTILVGVNCVQAPNPQSGPDVYTYNITDVPRHGTSADGTVTAYSVGTTSSNLGDYPVLWIDSSQYLPDYDTTQHPVISQNMYRLKKYGTAPNEYWRFEHLGQSWLKHGFTSTNSNCGTPPPTQMWRPSIMNYEGFGGDVLGVNCTDTYGGSLNGNQSYLGPKNIVNASEGNSPFTRGTSTGDSTVRGRLQVPTPDVTSQPSGTRFFVDAYYVAADDSQFVRPNQTVAINGLNNASYREITASTINTSPSFASATVQQLPGIKAWQAVDSAVTLTNMDHDDYPNPSTGFRNAVGAPAFPGTFIRSRYITGAKVTPLGGGLYRYEYAVYNHNSHRSGASFSVPMPAGATVSNVTFHAPLWHSGEPYSNTPWAATRSSSALTFRTQKFVDNANTNALRWGCLYNFGFTADVAPSNTGTATVGLFRPGATQAAPGSVSGTVPTPTLPPMCGPADVGSQGGVLGSDNALDNNDFVIFIDLFFNLDSRADFGSQGGVPGADGLFDNNDFVVFIDEFFGGC